MKTLIARLTSTDQNSSALIIRLVLGIVLFAHGAKSLLGWFGGAGFESTMYYLTNIMQLPVVIGLSVILLQFFGAILLLLGVLVRPLALAVAGMFAGMILTVHFDHGFFMNWFGNKSGEGYEYHILVLALCAALLIQGAGRISVDYLINQKTRNT